MIAACLAIILAVTAPPAPSGVAPDSAGFAGRDSVPAADSVAAAADVPSPRDSTAGVAPDSAAAATRPAFTLREAGGFDVGSPGASVATEPAGLALDAFDRITLSDRSLRRLLRFDLKGTRLGEAGSLGDDPGRLRRPGGMAPAGALGLAVLDEENRRVLLYDLFGRYSNVRVEIDVAAEAQGRVVPSALASDRAGFMYVGDGDQDRVLVFDAAGAFARVLSGYAPGGGSIRGVAGLAVGPRGDVVICERASGRVVRLDPTGAIAARWAVTPPPLGARAPAAIDDSLRIAIADPAARTIRVFDAGGRLLARARTAGEPVALTFHRDGALWVAERDPVRVSRRVLTPAPREP